MLDRRESPREYGVSAQDRAPLVDFMIEALRAARCRIIHQPDPSVAPFRVTFETPAGERMGIVAYAYLATFTPTRNRPEDEHSFQIKYGSKDGKLHELWQDPYGLYVTLLLGINPGRGFFVGADPVLHGLTKFFIRVEFKQAHVDDTLRLGWHAWERVRRQGGEPVEVLVGGTAQSFLRYVRFEREALGEDQGHRHLLAERLVFPVADLPNAVPGSAPLPSKAKLHGLAREFEMTETEVLDLIAGARRLKMAVRGWVAEEHLVRTLRTVEGVSDCVRLDEEGGPDVSARYEGSRPIAIECKNVLRERTAAGLPRVDFQRTRASKADPCSRFYAASDFDVVAACLHPVTERWEFRYACTANLAPHPNCPGKLSNVVRIDESWQESARAVLRAALNR
jgi:hypothetical protein